VGETLNIPLRILLDGETVDSETRATSVGAYILVVDTVIPEHGIQLHSTYTGHRKVPTHAIHLKLAPDLRESVHIEHDHDTLPVTHARRCCLYDHLGRLQDFLAQLDHQASIPLGEQAITTVEA
jgi:hypothetical protein